MYDLIIFHVPSGCFNRVKSQNEFFDLPKFSISK